MWIILILLLAGTLAGFAFSGSKKVFSITDKATLYIIYALLFFMGLSVGSKPEIMKNLTEIGIKALMISLFAIAGSVFTAFFLYRFIFRKNEK